MATLLEQAGGLDGLRTMLADFYERVFADVMIGFFFEGADKARLVEKELELTRRALGDEVPYTGRPLHATHKAHHIMGGHFMRRLQLLREAMAAADMPEAVVAAVVEHTERLRDLVTPDPGGDCDPTPRTDWNPKESL